MERKAPTAALVTDELTNVPAKTIVRRTTRTLTERRPRGSYTGLRTKLLALSFERAIRVPFEGESGPARDLLAAVAKEVARRNEGYRFSIRREVGQPAFFVLRVPV